MTTTATQIGMAQKTIDKALEYLREAKHELKKNGLCSDSRIIDYHVRIAILDLQQAMDTLTEEIPPEGQ